MVIVPGLVMEDDKDMPEPIKHIVNVSGGAASALSLIRVIERFGTASTSARLADVLAESDGLYKFVDELQSYCGIEIVRLSQGISTWELFEQQAMWSNPQTGGCIASYDLKRVPLRKHAESIGSPEVSTIYVGFGPDEDDRMERLRLAGAPWRFDFPLIWKPKLGRCDVLDELRKRGLHPSDAYERGYPHDNCKQKCILAGIGQWQKLLLDDPATYDEGEQHEIRMMALMRDKGRKECTILRDRRGGTTKNLSLTQLRLETLSGERPLRTTNEMESCSCVGTLWA